MGLWLKLLFSQAAYRPQVDWVIGYKTTRILQGEGVRKDFRFSFIIFRIVPKPAEGMVTVINVFSSSEGGQKSGCLGKGMHKSNRRAETKPEPFLTLRLS